MQACGPKHQEEPDCGFVQNVYGERVSWKSSVPVTLYVHEAFPEEMVPALKSAIAVWNKTAGRDLVRLAESYRVPGEPSPRQDGMSVVYWMSTWEKDKKAEQARTSVYWTSDEIREADIRINDADFDFYVDTPKSGKDVHLESIFVHELGHVLGLKHNDQATGSVMATYLSSQTLRIKISDLDRENIRCEY